MKNKLDFKMVKNYFSNLFADILMVYSERGFEVFKKPFFVSLIIIGILFFSYVFISQKASDKKDKLNWFESVKGYYDTYTKSKKIIKEYSKKLPSKEEKSEFINRVLNTAASNYRITFSEIGSQSETTFGKLTLASRQVKFSTDFDTLIRFLAEIENSEKYVEISNISVTKKKEPIGMLEVSIVLSTVFVDL